MTPTSVVVGLAIVFGLSWMAAGLWARQTVVRMPDRYQLPLYGAALAAVLLLFVAKSLFPALLIRLWEEYALFDWAMTAVCAIAFAWCWWARLHLGNLWSAGVSRKEGHRVVDTGPYGIVRHPIYTGAILAMFTFAAVRGRPIDLLFALFVAVFFSLKARLEERFLRQEFGSAYDTYSRRVARLVPFLRLWASSE